MDRFYFDRPRHKVEMYKGDKGTEKKAIVLPLTYAAKIPLPHNDFDPSVVNEWPRHDFGSGKASQYIPREVRTADDAIREINQFEIPKQLSEEARNLSRELIQLMEELGTPKTLRNQEYGRFDTRAMPRIIRDLRANKFHIETTRPFVRRERLNPRRPHIAVVGDGSWYALWNTPGYTEHMSAILLGISWACEAINCPVTAALCRNADGMRNQNYHTSIVPVTDFETSCHFNEFACLLHQDIYRISTHALYSSHPQTFIDRTYGIDLKDADFDDVINEAADSNADGVAWARGRGADIVVAIGNLADAAKADVRLGTGSSPKDAIKHLAALIDQKLNQRKQSKTTSQRRVA